MKNIFLRSSLSQTSTKFCRECFLKSSGVTIQMTPLWQNFYRVFMATIRIDHFTVVDLVSQPSSECEAEVDLVLIQTFFALLWKLFLETTSQHKNNLIYIIKHEGLYQTRSQSTSLPSITVKWPIERVTWYTVRTAML